MSLRPAILEIACLLSAGSAIAQQEIFVPAASVSFSLAAGKASRVGEPFAVKYRIENRGNRAFYVPKGFQDTVCLDPGSPGPHIWGSFVNAAGKRYTRGWGASCGNTPGSAPSMLERITKIAVLLRPGEHADGTFEMDPAWFQLPPGKYRVELNLRGWDAASFSGRQLAELQSMDPLLEGTASANITLMATR